MARTIGKAFKIGKKDVKSYGYATPNRRAGGRMTANAGVTAIAAINGPGAHARHHRGVSARAAMNGLSREERLARARKITGADRAAFARRMGAATKTRGTTMRTNASPAQIAAARRNIKKAIAARRAGGHRPNLRPMRFGRPLGRPGLRPNTWPGEVRRHEHAAARGWALRTGSRPPFASTLGTAARRRKKKKHTANSRRKKTMRTHRRNFSAKQRAAALRNLRKARAARKHRPNARKTRSRRKAHRRNGLVSNKRRVARRRSHRKNFSAKQRAAALRNLRKARAARKHRPNAKRRTARRSHRRNGLVSNKRRTHRRNFSAKQRAAALRNLRKARAARKHRPNRKHRRNTHRKAHRRSHRRNGLVSNGAFRRNQFLATAKAVLKIGAITTAGFVAHKAVTKVFTDQILDRILGSSGAASPAKPAAASGLEALQPYRSIIGGAAVAAAGVFLANKVVKDTQTKMFLTAGIATSLVHSIAVVALAKLAPSYSGYLSGDGTAANISAMYGFGAGASIMPEYHPINGLGEYFAQNGLGAYTSNPDLMQAAAGYGVVENQNSNIVDPGGDLDAQLSIAEAAAGVGAVPYEAAAGFGRVQPFEASAGYGGFGAVSTVPPTADTWIPGSSHGQLWAGTRDITAGQSAHEMVSAGIMETGGNQGVFG